MIFSKYFVKTDILSQQEVELNSFFRKAEEWGEAISKLSVEIDPQKIVSHIIYKLILGKLPNKNFFFHWFPFCPMKLSLYTHGHIFLLSFKK